MSLLNYIRGERKGTKAHRIEKDSMQDPFLFEALEGFDSIEDNHQERIAAIQKNIRQSEVKRTTKSRRSSVWVIVAAAAVVGIAVLSIQFLLESSHTDLYVETSMQAPIELYMPEALYTENIAIIAQKNTEFSKNISVKANQHKSKGTNELEAIIEKETEPIIIYLPN